MTKHIDYLADIRDFHRRYVAPFIGPPKGCSPGEIAALEKSFGYELPFAYQQYLAWMGKDYDGIFVGCDWFITDVAENTKWVAELLKENQISFRLPEHYLCFFSHQGYIVAWFELPKVSENPPTWFYHEGMEMKRPEVQGRFTDVLFKDMRGMAACLARIKSVT